MKISKLLAARQRILRQARLAALAHAYATLKRLADLAVAVKLAGRVRLQRADPDSERYWPALTALEGSQSRLEEHFSDEDLLDLAEAVVMVVEADYAEIEFRLEHMHEQFVAPMRSALIRAGVEVDLTESSAPNVPSEKVE